MKFTTGWKIKKTIPYLTAGAFFIVLQYYGFFCKKLGVDEGIDSAIEMFGYVDPQAKEDFLECITLNRIFHW